MITTDQYKSLDEAYKYFNEKLFEGKLPECLITFQRKPKMRGYFWAEQFVEREGKKKTAEIALNPNMFEGRDDLEILSTLAHEMVHAWQQTFGDAPRRNYHDKEWGAKMKEIGLYPSSTGERGGKETGQSMTHYIIDGGKFEIAAGAFLLKGNKIFWNTVPQEKKESGKKKQTRAKFTCPECMSSLWGKPSLRVICGDCNVEYKLEEGDN